MPSPTGLTHIFHFQTTKKIWHLELGIADPHLPWHGTTAVTPVTIAAWQHGSMAAWRHLVLQDPIRWEVAQALAVRLFTGLLLGNLGGFIEQSGAL